MKGYSFVHAFNWKTLLDVLNDPDLMSIKEENKYSVKDGLLIESDDGFTLDDLRYLGECYNIVNKHDGLGNCKSILCSVNNSESEYGSRLGVEYKKSSKNPDDLALILCDDGTWCEGKHYNHELDNARKFLDIKQLFGAVLAYEACAA